MALASVLSASGNTISTISARPSSISHNAVFGVVAPQASTHSARWARARSTWRLGSMLSGSAMAAALAVSRACSAAGMAVAATVGAAAAMVSAAASPMIMRILMPGCLHPI